MHASIGYIILIYFPSLDKQQMAEVQQQQIQQIKEELKQANESKKYRSDERITSTFPQPELITGGELRPYQLAVWYQYQYGND